MCRRPFPDPIQLRSVQSRDPIKDRAHAPAGRRLLRSEQCVQLAESVGMLAIAQLVAAVACSWLLLGHVGDAALASWLVAVVALQSLALPWSQRVTTMRHARAAAQLRAHRLLRAGAFASGMLWGGMPWWVHAAPALAPGLVAFVVAVVAGAAVGALSFDAAAALGFAGAALLPLSLWLSLQPGLTAHVAAAIAAAYLLLLALITRGAQQRFARGLGWRARGLHEIARRERQTERMRRVARLNELLVEASHIGAASDDVEEFEQSLCRTAVQRAGISQSWIARAGAASAQLRVSAACPAQEPGVPWSGIEQARQAWDDARPCFAGASSAARTGDGLARPSVAALALRDSQGVTAVLVLCFDATDAFDPATVDTLTQLAVAVERGLHALAQRRSMQRLQGLYRALMNEGDVLLQARSVPEMLLRTCQTLTEGTHFHAAWMARPDEQGRIEVIARAGSGADQLDSLRISLHDENQSPLAIRVWKSHRDVCCNDLLGDPRMAPWRASMVAYEWRSALATPVFRGGAIWAVLVFVSPQAQAFDEPTTELCRRVAELLGHGLDELDTKRRLNELQQEESHRARHDLLTGLPNRFALTQYLPQALAAARREGSVVAVGMIDLDDFKPVNDTWGHDAGDRLLRELGQRLRGAIRKFDVLVRLGGDEFIVVLEQIDSEQVLGQLGDVLRRLHDAVQQPFEIAPGCHAGIGMTMGLALYPLDAQDPDGLMRQADAAMYQAKLHKHDRARWWRLAPASAERLEGAAPRASTPPQLQVVSSEGRASPARGSGG